MSGIVAVRSTLRADASSGARFPHKFSRLLQFFGRHKPVLLGKFETLLAVSGVVAIRLARFATASAGARFVSHLDKALCPSKLVEISHFETQLRVSYVSELMHPVCVRNVTVAGAGTFVAPLHPS